MKGSIDESRDSVDERQGRPTKLVVRKCRSSDSNGQFVKKPFPRGVEDRTIGLRRRGLAAIGEGEMKSNQKRTFLNRARRPANGLCASFLNRARRPANGLCASFLNRARRPPNGLCASLRHLIVFAILLAIASVITAAENSAEVPFPEGYASWQHVKSVVIGPEHKSFASEGGKVFHFYANPQAIEGYRTGRFPNGSVIVRETLRTIAGQGESKGILTEGERSSLDVMVKDDRLYKETGGWGFETFDSKNVPLAGKDRAQCYACHSSQKDHDFVFSSLRTPAETGTPYPEEYRRWTFLHSSMVPPTFDAFAKKPCEKPCTAGIFHFYANDKAMEGLGTGSYPDGAIIAEEMLEWQSASNGGGKEGPRRLIGVMVKDSQRYGSTGGWGYGSFDNGSRRDKLDAKAREGCHQCHLSRKDQGYVFTEYRQR